MIALGIMLAPVPSLKEAELRYGPLDSEYKMVNEEEWIVPYSFESFGLPYKNRVNKDILMPLTLVMYELMLTGLIKEITSFQGCFASRNIRGTSRPSTHAYGLGCDFNHTKFSEPFVDIWKRYGWCWGGDFNRWKDYMHFSYSYECLPNIIEQEGGGESEGVELEASNAIPGHLVRDRKEH